MVFPFFIRHKRRSVVTRRVPTFRPGLMALDERAVPDATQIYSGSATLAGPKGSVALTQTVTLDSPGYEGYYLWKYHLVNTSFPPSETDTRWAWTYPGAFWGMDTHTVFTVTGIDSSSIQSFDASKVNGLLYGDRDVFAGGFGWDSGGYNGPDSVIAMGEQADFWFTTQPVPVITALASFSESDPVASSATGQVKGPGTLPQVVITKADGTGIDPTVGLKVAKWQDAFEVVTNAVKVKGPDANGWDFIDRDPDRFNVRVYDAAAWAAGKQTVDVTLETQNVAGFEEYNDEPTTLRLVRMIGADNVNWYWSDSQMLVSNTVDDEYSTGYLYADEAEPGASTNSKNGCAFPATDRTHIIALGGTVKAKYTPDGMPSAIVDQDPVLVKKLVKVHVTVVREVAGEESFTAEEAEEALIAANEQYAQVGIRLVSTVQVIDPPALPAPGVDPTDGLEDRSAMRGVSGATPEEKRLLDAAGVRSVATDDIELIFFNYFATGNRGYAILNGDYIDTAFVSFRSMTPFTVSHEIGHLLTACSNIEGAGLSANDRVNIMRAPTSGTDTVTATKRFNSGQESSMFSYRPNLLTDPT